MQNYKYFTILDNIISIFIHIILIFKKENKKTDCNDKSIMIIKMAEQGTNTYLIEYISKLKVDQKVTFVCLEGHDVLLKEYHPDINFIIIKNIKEFISFLLRKDSYQTIYSLDQKRNFSSLLVFKKYCELIGFFNIESDLYTTLPIYNTRHITKFYSDIFGFETKQNYSNEKNKKDIIIIYPNLKDQLKLRKWPIDYYFKLINYIKKNTNFEIQIIGSQSEKFLLENYFSDYKVYCELSMKELLEKYNEVRYQITSDCGVAHFASLKGVKQIVLFGPENKSFMLPNNAIGIQSRMGCSPCFSVKNNCIVDCVNNECMQSISPEEVYFRFLDLIGEKDDSKKKI